MAIFGAVAEIVLAGTPLSGLGALPLGSLRFYLGCIALVAGFSCICTALLSTLRLLRADPLYFSSLYTKPGDDKDAGAHRSDRESSEIKAIRSDYRGKGLVRHGV